MREVKVKVNNSNNFEDLVVTQKMSCNKRYRSIINVTSIVVKKGKTDKKRDKNIATCNKKKDRKCKKHCKSAKSKKETSRDKCKEKSNKKSTAKDKMHDAEDRIIPRCFRSKCFQMAVSRKQCEKIENKPKSIVKINGSYNENKLQKMLTEYRETERKRREYQKVLRLHEDHKKYRKSSIEKFSQNSDTGSILSYLEKDRNIADISLENISDDTILSEDMDISIHSDATTLILGDMTPDIHTCSTPKLDELRYSPISSAEHSPYFKLYNTPKESVYNTNSDENLKYKSDVLNNNEKHLEVRQNSTVTYLMDEAYSPISSADELTYSAISSSPFKSYSYVKVKTETISPEISATCYTPSWNLQENSAIYDALIAGPTDMSNQIDSIDFIKKEATELNENYPQKPSAKGHELIVKPTEIANQITSIDFIKKEAIDFNENYPQETSTKLMHDVIVGTTEKSNQMNNNFINKNEINIPESSQIKKEVFESDSNNNEDFSYISDPYTKQTSELNTSAYSSYYSPIRCEKPHIDLVNSNHIKRELEDFEIKTEPMSPDLSGNEEEYCVSARTAGLSSNKTNYRY